MDQWQFHCPCEGFTAAAQGPIIYLTRPYYGITIFRKEGTGLPERHFRRMPKKWDESGPIKCEKKIVDVCVAVWR